MHQVVPALEVGGWGVQAQLVADQAIQTLLVQHARHLVDGVHIGHGDHAPLRHVGEEADLFALVVRDHTIRPTQQRVRLDADFAHFLHGVLSRFGLELTGGGDPGHVGQVHEGRIVGAHAQAELAHRLQEGQGLNITHRAADLHNRHIDRVGCTNARAALHELLDFVGDVRNDLHGLTQVVPPPFFFQYRLVDLPGREVVGFLHPGGDEALIVAQVQVGFSAVVGHKHLAVLERAHGAWVHIEVRVQLDQGDFEAA